MRKGDSQLAIPYTEFTAAKATIEAIDAPVVGMVAYATDNPTAPYGTFNGSTWDWTVFASTATEIHAASAASLADADELGFWQSAGNILKKITWVNVKVALNLLYARLASANTFTATQTVKVADATKAIVLTDDSDVEWLSIKRSGVNVTVDVPSPEPTNEMPNGEFNDNLDGWETVRDYVLNDQFITDRAAGAVNGTSAEPTGGTRTVVDASSKLSISSSQLQMATGATSYIKWTSETRTAGKVFMGTFTPSVDDIYLGISTNGVGLGSASALRLRTSALGIYLYEDGGTPQLTPFVSGTTYNIAMVLRTTGTYYYIKGGIFTNWTLMWISSTVSTGGSPMIYGTGGVLTADNIRIPTSTWLPTPLSYDTFTRADGAIGNTEANSPDGTTLPAHAAPILAWTNQVGTVAVASGKAIATALGGDRAICTFPCGSADVLHSAALIRGTTGVGIVLRYVDTDNYVYAKRIATNIVIIKRIAGSETTLATVAATEVSSAVLLVIFYGTKLRPYYNNALLGSELTISDTGIQSADKMGLIFFDTDSTADLVTTFGRYGHTSAPFEELVATRDTETKYSGAASAKLVAGGTNADFWQSVNVGDTLTYNMIAYAYTTGAAITSADLELFYDGAVLSTTFTSMGGGWYKLEGSLTGVASAKDYGFRVKAGVTVYVDSVSLQAGTGVTTILNFGNSGTGSMLVKFADGLKVYADNAAALSAGLTAGMLYRVTGTDYTGVVH